MAGQESGSAGMRMWGLWTCPVHECPELLAEPVAVAFAAARGESAWAEQAHVAAIEPELADTASCCAAYEVPAQASANCVVIAGKRGGTVRVVACVALATTRVDVNGVVRSWLGVRKASFATQDEVTTATGMAYGGITPIGLPADWPVLVDTAAVEQEHVVLGSGMRGSKLVLPGSTLSGLPGAEVCPGLARPVAEDFGDGLRPVP